jgi:aminoglycoside phosphotransferase (APT) family kinase protein
MPLIDQPTVVRPGDELDMSRIDPFLKRQLPGLHGDAQVSQFVNGASNLTYLLRYDDREMVLRRPPPGLLAHAGHDMGREFQILSQLPDAFAQAPRAWAYCADATLIGSPFYVMERVRGIILRTDLPAGLDLEPSRCEALCKRFIETLVSLHQVDYSGCGLAHLGTPDGYVQRQIHGWIGRYEQALTADAPRWRRVQDWLQAKMPADSPRAVLVHNDYRFDNLVLGADDPLRIVSVLDWELATLGDPLMDLGNALAYWIEADDPAPMQLMRSQPSHAPGMLTRRQLAEYYAEQSGLPLDHYDFYCAYGLFRLAGILQQLYHRYFHGQARDPRFAQFIRLNALLEQMCLKLISQSSL